MHVQMSEHSNACSDARSTLIGHTLLADKTREQKVKVELVWGVSELLGAENWGALQITVSQ